MYTGIKGNINPKYLNLGCMETETDAWKRNVSKRENVILIFFCFGNVFETSINIYIYIYIYIYVTD